MSDTLKLFENINKYNQELTKPARRLNESEAKEYRYITNHGIGPGTVPDKTFVRSEDLDNNKTAIYLNRPLSDEELKKYDIKPEWIQESEKVNEAELPTDDQPMVYMNTWKNYNENGADLEEMYGITDGWMTPEQAREFAEKYADDEPFINDTDNMPWEVGEYDNIEETLNYLEKYNNLDHDNQDILKAIIESLGNNDLENAFQILESGDYTFFAGVETDQELGEAYVNLVGGLGGVSNAANYIDEDAYRESWREAAEDTTREEGIDEDSEEFENRVEELMTMFANEQLEIDKLDNNDLSQYFDYEALGNELDMEGFFFASTGAIQIN